MKLNKLLTSFATIATISTITVPIVGCSCNNFVEIELTNQDGEDKYFGLGANLCKGTSYNFNADFNKWDAEHTKPTDDEWKQNPFLFDLFKKDQSKLTFQETDSIVVTCDGKDLKKGTQTEFDAGTVDYTVSTINDELLIYFGSNHQNSPIKPTSKMIIKNVKLDEDAEVIAMVTFGV